MAKWIRVDGTNKERIIKVTPLESDLFDDFEIFLILGVEHEIVKLLSGDLLFIEAEPDGQPKNELASLLTKRDVFGSAILLEPSEYENSVC